MEHWLINNLLTFGLALVLTGMLIPQILVIAFRKRLFDGHDARKVHTGEVPRLGGIAFVPAIIFSVLATVGLVLIVNSGEMVAALDMTLVPLLFLICSLMLLFLVGIADDLIGVRYGAKFLFQILASALLIGSGVWVSDFYGLFTLDALPLYAGWPVTILAVVMVVNAINLIDGIDGLASGLSGVACAFYTYMFFHAGLYLFSAIAVATLGVLVPFFVYNVFGDAEKQRKIFMGDTGALTIGLLLSAMSLRICQLDTLPEGCNPAVVAFAPLLIPCFDVVRVYLHRIRIGHNPFHTNKNHIHHKFLALGMSQRSAMMVIIAASTALVLANYWLSAYINITSSKRINGKFRGK